jgi:hypothetical protein
MAAAISTSLVWSWGSSVDGARAGTSSAGPGDLNGDGFDDLAVGAYLQDGTYTGGGVATVFYGGVDGFASAPDWAIEGDEELAYLGWGVAGAGDIDADGFADLLVSAHTADSNGVDAGVVHVFYGAASGLASVADLSLPGPGADAYFGIDLAGVGDVNGDGYADVLIGAAGATNSVAAEGGAFLHYGSDVGLSPTAGWTAWSGQADAYFGRGVNWAGDVNGDGYSDVLIGAPFFDAGEVDEGAAFVYFGGQNGPGAGADWSVADAAAGDGFGLGLSGVGDTDGDGYGELLIGAYLHGPGGGVWLYPGSASGPQASPVPPRTLSNSGSRLGYVVEPGGDLDRDGYADAAFSGYSYDGSKGFAFLYSGSSTGLDFVNGGQDIGWPGTVAGLQVGRSMAFIGDSDGNGRAEEVVGRSGWNTYASAGGGVAQYESDPPTLAPGAMLNATGAQPSAAVALRSGALASGDLDGDGYDELIVGRSGWTDTLTAQGAVAIYFGSRTGISATEDVLLLGEAAGEYFGIGVGVGDVDADGELDLLVGSQHWDGGGGAEGRVQLFAGTPTGVDPVAGWQAEGDQLGAQFGWEVDAIDVHGDGHADVLIGARFWDQDHVDGGAVFLFEGGPDGPAASSSWSFFGESDGAELGYMLQAVGDTNGDGYEDVGIGAPFHMGAASEVGQAFLFEGGPEGLLDAPSMFLQGVIADEEVGRCLAGGDVDGDGYSDFFVGAQALRTVSVHWGGPGGPSTTDVSTIAGPSYTQFGLACAVGDRDRDGFADLLTGAPSGNGDAFVFPGSPSGVVDSWDYHWQGSSAERKGIALHSGADLDGDGATELVVGSVASGAGHLEVRGGLEGSWGGEAAPLRPRMREADSATPLPVGGRSSTGGVDVVGWVRSPSGRARGKLQVEAKAAGLPFDGSGLLDSGSWVDLGLDGLDLVVPVRALDTSSAFHLRARSAFDPSQNPPVRFGPWGSLDPADPTGIHFRTHPDGDGDGFGAGEECDDTNPAIFPGATEVADDGVDQDCDGVDAITCFVDSDGDGAAGSGTAVALDGDCDDAGEGATATDCDDVDPAVYPGAPEACDGDLEDCDGTIDAGFDGDGDGYLDGVACEGVYPDLDCDDGDDAVYPGATEDCDLIDANCDGDLLDGDPDLDLDGTPNCADTDADGDGDPEGNDCDDLEPLRFTGNVEECDLLDGDCDDSLIDGEPNLDGDDLPDCVDPDVDGDGVDALAAIPDCDDMDPSRYPGAQEFCDLLDSDCDDDLADGFDDTDVDGSPDCVDLDDDGDGSPDNLDCGPTDPAVFPGAPEACNGADDDCNGSVSADEDDDDGDGFRGCAGDCDDADADRNPDALEVCNGVDDDCDDDADDGLAFSDWFVDADADGFGGLAHANNPLCAPATGYVEAAGDCDDADDTRFPGADEACNGVDDDCDGEADEGLEFGDWFLDADSDGFGGTPHPDNPLCAAADGYVEDESDCDDADGSRHPDAMEVCNGLDDDCDGEADDGLVRPDWFLDEDGDGWGSTAHPENPLCVAPDGYVERSGDCDDTKQGVNPDQIEVEDNLVDEDCDGTAQGSGGDAEAVLAPGIACSSAGGSAGLGGLLLLVWRRRSPGPGRAERPRRTARV